jgi:D-glycero-D-manno-heptose 1,7-bisphosphate phosphatase
MVQQLKKYNLLLDAIYYCPHKREDQCFCRKPQPGMILQAIFDFDIDSTQSWIIGDKISDIEAGKRADTRTFLVLTGYGKSEWQQILRDQAENKPISFPDATAPSLWEATDFILAHQSE